MKNIAITLFTFLLVVSCNEAEQKSAPSDDITKVESKEISQVQESKIMKSSEGEEVKVTYFAEGDMVAVKLQKTGEEEQTLSAKSSSAQGNPIFTNENYMWEMTDEGAAGKLSDKEGNATEYK